VQYWLMKNEPEELSIDDLASAPNDRFLWDGVRGYQARNMLRDQMHVGDTVLFYYSSVKVPGIAGLATIDSQPVVDTTQFEPDHKYYDPASDPTKPRWITREVKFLRRLERYIPLSDIRQRADQLGPDFALLRRANRLSIMPVTPEQYRIIMALETPGSTEFS
jgi:predicted RNA-binding protein with PUA-like domain